MKRIVVKVGSNVLTRPDGKLDVTRMSALIDQIACLRTDGHQVILVSSGAMAAGRGEMDSILKANLSSVEQRQLYSAVGQVKLIGLYYDLCREHGINIGQVLTMKESFSTRREYLNQRACMSVMLDNGVLPIVNENDTVSVTELMFTDNDELAGLIAAMMNADELIVLSNIDGIYTGKPSAPETRLITRVEQGQDISEYIRQEKSAFGRGGMITKCSIARKVADEGIRVIIANGRRDNILIDIQQEKDGVPFTEFVPNATPVSGVKKWIAHSDSFTKGTVYLKPSAVEALRGERAVSLLLVGVSAVEGDFREGDLIAVADTQGRHIGLGRSAYNYEDAARLIGEHGLKPLIHYDYLYLE